MRATYLVPILAVLAILVAGAAYAASGQMVVANDPMTRGTMGGMGPMMNGGGMSGGTEMTSFDENRPSDLQFIDQMTIHHQMAIMSSEHMISDS